MKAQPVQEIEDQIFQYLVAIEKWDTTLFDANGYTYDSLQSSNKTLLDYLSKVLVKNKATLHYDFKKLNESRLHIHTADDKKFRIFCWYVGGGGTARSYNALVLYQGLYGPSVIILNDESKTEGPSGAFYSELHTLHTNSKRNVYLAVDNVIAWSGGGVCSITAYTIDKGKLNNKIKIFKTATKYLNSISFYYDFSAGVNRGKTIAFPQFKWTNDKRKLYVPLIKENEEITDKYLIYKWDGNYYTFSKNLEE